MPPLSTTSLAAYVDINIQDESKTKMSKDDYASGYGSAVRERLMKLKNNSTLGLREAKLREHLRKSAKLPTLGLRKYQHTDLTLSETNPYRQHKQTEKLLVARERERDFNIFSKLEREETSIFSKGNTAKPCREGVIRSIRDIPETSLTGP